MGSPLGHGPDFTFSLASYGPGLVSAFGHLFLGMLNTSDSTDYATLAEWTEVLTRSLIEVVRFIINCRSFSLSSDASHQIATLR